MFRMIYIDDRSLALMNFDAPNWFCSHSLVESMGNCQLLTNNDSKCKHAALAEVTDQVLEERVSVPSTTLTLFHSYAQQLRIW